MISLVPVLACAHQEPGLVEPASPRQAAPEASLDQASPSDESRTDEPPVGDGPLRGESTSVEACIRLGASLEHARKFEESARLFASTAAKVAEMCKSNVLTVDECTNASRAILDAVWSHEDIPVEEWTNICETSEDCLELIETKLRAAFTVAEHPCAAGNVDACAIEEIARDHLCFKVHHVDTCVALFRAESNQDDQRQYALLACELGHEETCFGLSGLYGAKHRGSPVTLPQFRDIAEGLSYRAVAGIAGAPGTKIAGSPTAPPSTVTYRWKNRDGSSMEVTFTDGKVIAKTQVGLE